MTTKEERHPTILDEMFLKEYHKLKSWIYKQPATEQGIYIFIMGYVEGVADDFSHEYVRLEGIPSKEEIERYYQMIYHSPLSDVVQLACQMEKHVCNPVIIKKGLFVFFTYFYMELARISRHPETYSAFLDSQHVYSKDQLREFGFPDWMIGD
jgi:hypothetical protein